MARIYRVACDACPFEREVESHLMFVLRDDGTEQLCLHPGEIRCAEAVTGRSAGDLRRTDRLRERRAHLCLACGEVGYYRSHAGAIDGVWDGDIVYDLEKLDRRGKPFSLVVRPERVQRTGELACAVCTLPRLVPAGGGDGMGCLMALLTATIPALRPVPEVQLCPTCSVGHLRWEMVGIT
jgi:hypothetical protein